MNQSDSMRRPSGDSPRRLHPLIAAAVAAVLVASLAATAAVTGLFPKASSTTASIAPAPATSMQPAQEAATPAPPAPSTAYVQQQPVAPAPTAPAYCPNCGTVEAVSAVRHEGHGTGIGAVGGAVAGGVVGNQFGRGGGRTAMTLLGALGGGLAGNSVEKHLRSSVYYSVRVHMESGRTRYFSYRQPPPFQRGEPVRIERGTLVAAG